MASETILIVDDNTQNLAFLSSLLKDEGYAVLPANDGELALASLEENKPDLILLDVKMPGIDGFEVCRRIKKDEQLSEIPLIFLTVANNIEDKLEGFRLGAVDYITKPFHKEELLARIKTHLHLYRYSCLFKERDAENLIDSERQLSNGERAAHVGSWEMEIETGKSNWSDEFFRICGLEPQSIKPTAEDGFKLIHPEDREKASIAVQFALSSGKPYDIEKRIIRPDGSVRWVHSVGEIIPDDDGKPFKLSGSFQDITYRKEAEESLKTSLKEKETLLQEIHHRVKNNMQVISSLLKLQEMHADDERVSTIIKESQSRIYSMSAVHETLYRSSNLSEVEIKPYLEKVAASLIQTFAKRPEAINLQIDSPVIKVNVQCASTIGLIVNEIVSNSLKHAFPDTHEGSIKVTASRNADDIVLTIADNGIGFPNDFNWQDAPSLGLKLVNTLVKDQLEGSIVQRSDQGVSFEINFNPRSA